MPARRGRRESSGLQTVQAAADRLLLIHPDAGARPRYERVAQRVGLTMHHARTFDDALPALSTAGPFGSVVVVASQGDRLLDESNFLANVRTLIRNVGQASVVIVTERHFGIAACCDLVRAGVAGFVDARSGEEVDDILADRLARAKEHFVRAQEATRELHTAAACCDETFVWRSPAMGRLIDQATKAAQVSDVPILIYGESGTGKQLLAEYIHRLDPKRNTNRFMPVNCSAISGTLAESTLFGHLKGAYTGATGSRKGVFRAADRGTVLLDEIGEMDLLLQPKLLRVLQEGAVLPLGADDEVEVDVRVIAATNRRLAALVEEGKFRLDLYQRLNVITLEIPPLRERPEDIPALVRFFLKKYARYCDTPVESADPDVFDFLSRCTLAGNVRELENAIRQTLAFKTSGNVLTLADIPPAILADADLNAPGPQPVILRDLADAAFRLVDSGNMTLPELVDACEKLVLKSSLAKSSATSAELARQLGLSRRTLYNKIQKYRLSDFDRS